MKKIALIFSILLSAGTLFSVPALRDARTVKEADGKELTIRLHGDEFFHYTTTEDGFLIAKGKNDFFEYAQMQSNGTITTQGWRANNADKRTLKEKRFLKKQPTDFSVIATTRRNTIAKSQSISSKSFPLSGSPRSLVILVEFKNKAFTVSSPQEKFTDLLNQEGYSANGGTGSARDYFRDNSCGKFVPQFDVVGPFKLDNDYAYYGGNVNNNDKNPRQMVVDACIKAAEAGVKFSDYDSDNDGVVDNIFIYYAGYNEAEGGPDDTIWPHRWIVSTSITFDGKRIKDYACTSELKGNSGGAMCGIGTFCHEFCHVLGLPDFYATNGAKHGTLGSWDIMDYGPYNNQGRTPPFFSAYERFALGWLKPTILKDPAYITIDTLSTSNTAYLIAKDGIHNLCGGRPIWDVTPMPAEFFLLENRQQNSWDRFIGGHGMLVFHIDYNKTNWNSNTVNNDPDNMGCDIIEADGMANKGTYAGDPFPGLFEKRFFFPKLKNGTDLNQPLTYIVEENGLVSFRYKGGGEGYSFFDKENDLKTFVTVAETPSPSQEIVLIGKRLETSYKISFKTDTHFQFCLKNSGQDWISTPLTVEPIDSTIQDTLLVRYFPMEASFNATHNDTILIKCDLYTTLEVPIVGQSRRPIKVTVPVATETSDITENSFVANWEASNDATGYYISVYSEEEGQTNALHEGFKIVLDKKELPFEWEATFDGIQTEKFGKDSPSLPFSNSSDTLITEHYLFPIEKIEFWLYNFSSGGSHFKVEGFDGETWQLLDDIEIKTIDREMLKKVDLPTGNTYSRFRFTFVKNKGMLYFDDFTVYFSKKINYVMRHKYVAETHLEVKNLFPGTAYKYYVQATDKTMVGDSVLYANITRTSNEITATTLSSDNPRTLMIRTKSDNSGYIVKIDETQMIAESLLYIYSVQGHLITTVQPTGTIVDIPQLPPNNFYIIRYSKRGKIRPTDPTAKLFYQ
ncbi:MAG TPA: M6 family metalloprotease domain-containing protein [Paludibacteraceae bacterium]|nr:M6 family metalloprotease domain-containing protein [Paludibacteraceae bacterium]